VVLGSGAPILHKLPLFTFHAYNQVSAEPYDPVSRRGGWCLYTLPEPHEVPVPVPPTVSVRRPGGGTGRTPWDSWNADPYDPTPRQTFVHWDAPFIAWLERSGYQADYCTDLDLHEDRALLDPDRLLVSVGHDEYWSDEMRGAVARFAARGGNVAFFSGNTCWKRVVFDDPVTFRRLERWPSTPGAGSGERAHRGELPQRRRAGPGARAGADRLPRATRGPLGLRRDRPARRGRLRGGGGAGRLRVRRGALRPRGPRPGRARPPHRARRHAPGFPHPRRRRRPRGRMGSATGRPPWACTPPAARSSPPPRRTGRGR